MIHSGLLAPVPRVLVVIPNWVGDVVLASPTLAALRDRFQRSHIAYVLRPYVAEIVHGCGWHDELIFWPQRASDGTLFGLVGRLRAAKFDLALLLTNSFRSALTAWLARVPRRVGYVREARGWMLTDRLRPLKRDGEFIPASVLPYYAAVAEAVGCPVPDRTPRLGIAPDQERRGVELMRHYGLGAGQPYALINPGAKFGAAKCWLPERFAEVCDRLAAEWDLLPVLIGSPDDGPLLRDIARRVRGRVACCVEPGTTLGSLKPLAREASLMICNDTGPRHYAIAFGVPTVTIFGPTHPEWTDTGFRGEIKLQVPVECGPCQLPTCPLDHRCMTELTSDLVLRAASELLERRPPRRGAKVATPAAADPERADAL